MQFTLGKKIKSVIHIKRLITFTTDFSKDSDASDASDTSDASDVGMEPGLEPHRKNLVNSKNSEPE